MRFSSVPIAGPRTVDVVALSLSMVLINWTVPIEDDVNGVLTGYTVYLRYFKDDDGRVLVTEEHVVPANATSSLITGLDNTRDYTISITASTTIGEGSVSSLPSKFTTS